MNGTSPLNSPSLAADGRSFQPCSNRRAARGYAACTAGWLGLLAAGTGFQAEAQIPDLVTNSFQNGVAGYASAEDASISTQYAEFTSGNGVTRINDPLLAYQIDYETRSLIRFNNLTLPVGAEVQAATLDLMFNNYETGFTLAGYYLKVSWNRLATGDTGLGWLHRDTGINWHTPGAGGIGTDVLAGKSFSIANFAGLGDEPKSVALDPDVVQTWVSDPMANQGLLLINTVSNKTMQINWSGAATVAHRPRLTIVYRPGVPPTIAQAAAAAPNPVSGTTNLLSVLGADDSGEPSLTYSWSAVTKPAGAPEPLFSTNGANAAKLCTATYQQAGEYLMQAIIRNRGGLTATSTVAVTVTSVISRISVSPANAKVVTNGTQLFLASALDQFDDPLAVQPKFVFSIVGLGGISPGGFFAAGAVPGGPYVVEAHAGGIIGTATVVVRLPNQLPVVQLTAPASGQEFVGQPITGWADIPLSANASDADGTVAKVEFYRGNDKLGEDHVAPYNLTLSNAVPGSYELTARAWDDEGGASTSAPVTVTVQSPPLLVEPFLAPPQPAGALTVDLHPTEGVTGNRLVTFGVPFPRGSISMNDLARIRVLRQGVEIPAYVDALSLWRHARNATVDGASVRVARIQIHHPVGTAWPASEPITVEWGVNNRTLNVAALENPRSAWHLVTNGTFTAADNVFEPDVLAVLPKSHLCLGLLKSARLAPLDDSVPVGREDPNVTGAIQQWPGTLELDHAVHNFFFTLINQDDPLVTLPNQCPYLTDSEPWLYDRAAAMFLLYFRSGHVQALREAVRHAQFYRNQLWPDTTALATSIGLFKLKWPDPAAPYGGGNAAMYSYNECLAYAYWLCGDAEVLPAINWVVQAHEANDEPTRWSPNEAGWTERHTAFRLLANVIAYEVFGAAAYQSNLLTQTADFLWHQNGAGGLLPTNRVDGGLYHYGIQHGDGAETNFVASSWMTALTLDAMLRAFAVTEDVEVAHFIRRLGNFWKASCKLDDQHSYDTYEGPLLFPDYMMTYDGASDPFDGRQYEMVEHALDVGSGVLWAGYFAALLGQPDASLANCATNLYFTYDIGVNYWTRPGGPAAGRPAYRVSPWRKYGWEHRLSGFLGWLLSQPEVAAPRPRLGFAGAPGGGFQLSFSGGAGTWRIETSPTLTNWTPFATVTNLVAGTNYHLPATNAVQFFRARALP